MILEILVLILATFILRHWLNRPKNLPPGPPTIPFIGSGYANDIKDVRKYREKYGDIFRLEIGNNMMVFLCNFKLIKEALAKNEFAGRPFYKSLHFLTDGNETGVIFSNGQRWSNSRRFLLRNLRDLGMGKSSLDHAIVQEAKYLVEDFKKFAGKPAEIPNSLNVAVLNIVWQMVSSFRYEYDDKEIHKLMIIIKALQKDFLGLIYLDMLPFVKNILPKSIIDKIFNMDILEDVKASSIQVFKSMLDRQRPKLDPSHAENVIDEYLIQMNKKTSIAEFFNESDLMRTVFDLFGAGFDTSAMTLNWFMLYAAKYPELQRKVQKQIDEVVPKGEFPSYHHKAQLPLVEAFIHEVLRISSLFPLGVMVATTTDTHFANYFIPKGTMVFWASGLCHEDPKLWDKPEEFRPERFLDEEGRFVLQKEGFIPFGLGKRICLGESLAKMELSIFGAALLQNFFFAPPEGKTIDLTAGEIQIANIPKKQDIVITIRK